VFETDESLLIFEDAGELLGTYTEVLEFKQVLVLVSLTV
jgi:hypothetical protein